MDFEKLGIRKKYYAGIGSRETPPDIENLMRILGLNLAIRQYVLRSGAADGADRAFMLGAAVYGGAEEIFLAEYRPRYDSMYGLNKHRRIFEDPPGWAMQTVAQYHPRPQALSDYAWKLMARNAQIILGQHGTCNVEFVLCWTKDGKSSGGTGQALRIAEDKGIKIVNLFHRDEFEKAKEWVGL